MEDPWVLDPTQPKSETQWVPQIISNIDALSHF